MDTTMKAARAEGKMHGIEVADLCASQISAGEDSDTDAAYAALLARYLGSAARDLKSWGMPDPLVQIWMNAAAQAGVARLQEFSHFLTQPKATEH